MILVFFGYIVMYRIYGRYISRVVFRVNKKANVPAGAKPDAVFREFHHPDPGCLGHHGSANCIFR